MKYFVLKPKGDDIYAAASRKAMRVYAKHVRSENPELADHLAEWADSELKNSLDTQSATLQNNTDSSESAVYGYCPECGAKGIARERRPNGNDKCANGHTYPTALALQGNTDSESQ